MGDELANSVQTDIDENRSTIDHAVNGDRSIKDFDKESNDSGIIGDTHSLTSSERNVNTLFLNIDQETCMTNSHHLKRTRPDVVPEDDEVKSKKTKHGNEDQEDVNDNGLANNTTNQTREKHEEIENTDGKFYKNEDDSCEEVKGSNSDVDTNITGSDEQDSETNADDDVQGKIVAKDSLASKPPTRPEANTFPKLYRLLRAGETVSEGLVAKDPYASVSVATHVATGSRGNGSKYISTCATFWAADNFRSLKTRKRCRYRNGVKDIVEIDVGQLPMNVNIIDLTTEEKRKQHETWNTEINEKFHKFASSHQEVLLVGKVPPECLSLT